MKKEKRENERLKRKRRQEDGAEEENVEQEEKEEEEEEEEHAKKEAFQQRVLGEKRPMLSPYNKQTKKINTKNNKEQSPPKPCYLKMPVWLPDKFSETKKLEKTL